MKKSKSDKVSKKHISATDEPTKGLHFLEPYADQIAHAVNMWAYVEYYIMSSIWDLAGVKPSIGACMTSQMYTLNAKLTALISLLNLRGVNKTIIKRANKFATNCRVASTARNRIAHDMWLNDKLEPSQMGKLRITADKQLVFTVESIDLSALKNDVSLIATYRIEAYKLRNIIRNALPTLPEIPSSLLHPIIESPSDL